MTVINLPALDEGMQTMLVSRTQRPVGLVESPLTPGWTYPCYIVYPLPSAVARGGFANPNDMGDITYQVTCVGKTAEQTSKAEGRAWAALDTYWADLPGVCGPPELSRRGTVRVQDDLYQAIIIVNLKVSAS